MVVRKHRKHNTTHTDAILCRNIASEKYNGITNIVYKKVCFQHKKYTKIWTYHAVVSLRIVWYAVMILLRRSYAVPYMIRVIA